MTIVVAETNAQVQATQLPDIAEIELQPIDPKYASTNLKLGLAFIGLFALLESFVWLQPFFDINDSFKLVLQIAFAIGLSISAIVTLYNYKADPLIGYALREHDLTLQSGLIFRKKVTQPITRIQHIELKRGPIERKIGLASLQVFSAGGALHTFEIPGLPLSLAQKIRQFILQHKDSMTHG